MIAGRFFFTPHAVRRYVTRAKRGLTYEKALDELIKSSERAHYVKTLDTGVELWRSPKPLRLRLYVTRGEGPQPAVITVLRRCDRD